MMDLDYIECDGVRVPAGWNIVQLVEALAKRKIRFHNEEEIMNVFGHAVELKQSLERQIKGLQSESITLDQIVRQKKLLALCPGCGMKWAESPISLPSALRKGRGGYRG